MLTLKDVQKNNMSVSTIVLPPLNKGDINQLLSDTLKVAGDDTIKLTELCMEKTCGNPFFLNQFLLVLHLDGLFVFDSSIGNWKWDIEQIHKRQMTDNVIDLMVSKIQKLNINTQNLLKLAACVGNTFNLKTLSIINKTAFAETSDILLDALKSGLVRPLDYSYKYAGLTEGELDLGKYQFLHDRIQQAAYSLMEEKVQAATHLEIGRLLLKSVSSDECERQIFDIVDHLNKGRQLIKEDQERYQLAKLNLRAGKKAKDSCAYEKGLEYIHSGLELSGNNGWESDYYLSLKLHETAAEIYYLTGYFKQMEKICHTVLEKAKNILDKTTIYEIQILSYIARNELIEAVKIGIDGLRLLNIKFPANPKKWQVILEILRLKYALRGKKIECLSNLPQMTDPYQLSVTRLLSRIQAVSLFTQPLLAALFILKNINLFMRYGNPDFSSFSHVNLGLLFCTIGEIQKGSQIGELSLKIAELPFGKKFKARTIISYNIFIRHWQYHLRETIPELSKSIRVGLDTGDIEFTAHAAHLHAWHSFFSGKVIQEIVKEIKQFKRLILRLKQRTSLYHLQIVGQLIMNLIEPRENPHLLNGEFYNEKDSFQIHEQACDSTALFILLLSKLIIAYLFEDYAKALEYGNKAKKYNKSVSATTLIPSAYFYHSLSRLAISSQLSLPVQKKLINKVKKNQKLMKHWAKNAPMNYLHRWHLIEAELARVQAKHEVARTHYKEAICLAGENGYIQDEALANELYAKFFLNQKEFDIAILYLKRSHHLYKVWGADGKVHHMEQAYPELLSDIISKEESLADTITSITHTQTSAGIKHSLDLSSVMKASRTISEEIRLEELLKKLMHVVIENGGAEKGVLLLNRSEGFTIAARTKDGVDVDIMPSPLDQDSDVPEAVIKFVERTSTDIVLDNASDELLFAEDSYIKNKKPKSVLCMPIIISNKLVAILYLENNLNTGVFTSNRQETLKIIAAQSAISLQNALLYENLMDEVGERNRAEESLRKSEEKYRNILEEMEDAYFEVDMKGNLVFINPSASKITGYSRDELIGMNFKKITNPEHIQRVLLHYGEIFRTGMTGKAFYWNLLRKNGENAFVEVVVSLVRDVVGNPSVFRGLGRDITERKKAEDELRKAEEKYRGIFDNATEGIFQTAPDGRILTANNAMSRILGYDSPEGVYKINYHRDRSFC